MNEIFLAREKSVSKIAVSLLPIITFFHVFRRPNVWKNSPKIAKNEAEKIFSKYSYRKYQFLGKFFLTYGKTHFSRILKNEFSCYDGKVWSKMSTFSNFWKMDFLLFLSQYFFSSVNFRRFFFVFFRVTPDVLDCFFKLNFRCETVDCETSGWGHGHLWNGNCDLWLISWPISFNCRLMAQTIKSVWKVFSS